MVARAEISARRRLQVSGCILPLAGQHIVLTVLQVADVFCAAESMFAVETAGERMLHRRLQLVDAADIALFASLRHIVVELIRHDGARAGRKEMPGAVLLGILTEYLPNLVLLAAGSQLARRLRNLTGQVIVLLPVKPLVETHFNF